MRFQPFSPGLLLGVAAGAYLGLSGYMAAHMSRGARTYPKATPESMGLQCEEVAFPNRGGPLLLKGWLIWDRPPSFWVILVHGNGGNRADPSADPLGLARDLVNRGMGVLAFDLRAHGESQGERISLDHHGRTDLQGAIDLLQSRGVARDHIGVVGFSLGAVMALMAAPTEPGLAGMVLDSPFTSMEDMVRQEVSRRGSLHRLLFPGMMLMGRALFGIDLSSVHPLEAVGEIECPLLFIHGEEDDMVDPSNSVRLFEAARVGSKELWLVPGSGHVESYLDRPEEYADRVCDFLDRGATTNTKGE